MERMGCGFLHHFAEKKLIYLLVVVLISLSVVVFFPTFTNDFQRGWDDGWQVLEYKYIVNHSFDDLVYHFSHYYKGQYMPVNTLLYIAIYEVFGFNPTAFHVASLLIHVVNVLLVFSLVKKMLCTVKINWQGKRVLFFSFLVALIFAIHPLQVESVAWISASKIPLYTFFFLLGFHLYFSYLNTNKLYYLIAMMFCYLLSYGSKEQAIIFPLNLLIFDYVFDRFREISFSVKSLKKRVFIEKTPFFVIALLLYLFSITNNLGTFSGENYPLYQRVSFGVASIMEYIFRTITPVKLYYFYFFPMKRGELLPLYYWGYYILITIVVIFIQKNYEKNNKILLFGFLFFFVNILLVLHIIPMPRDMITADRYMYLSMVGLGIVIVWLVQYVYTKYKPWKKIIVLLFTIWLLFLSVHSYIRTEDWKDSDSIKNNVNQLIEKRKILKETIKYNKHK